MLKLNGEGGVGRRGGCLGGVGGTGGNGPVMRCVSRRGSI